MWSCVPVRILTSTIALSFHERFVPYAKDTYHYSNWVSYSYHAPAKIDVPTTQFGRMIAINMHCTESDNMVDLGSVGAETTRSFSLNLLEEEKVVAFKVHEVGEPQKKVDHLH